MSRKKFTEATWDSDDELLKDDAALSLEVEKDEELDEDALLGMSEEEDENDTDKIAETVYLNDTAEENGPNEENEDYGEDTGMDRYREEGNSGGYEQEEATDAHCEGGGYQDNTAGGVSYEEEGVVPEIDLAIPEDDEMLQLDADYEDVSYNADTSQLDDTGGLDTTQEDFHSVKQEEEEEEVEKSPKKIFDEVEDESSDSDADEEKTTGRGRFRTERSNVNIISLTKTSKDRSQFKDTSLDNLGISPEDQKQLENFNQNQSHRRNRGRNRNGQKFGPRAAQYNQPGPQGHGFQGARMQTVNTGQGVMRGPGQQMRGTRPLLGAPGPSMAGPGFHGNSGQHINQGLMGTRPGIIPQTGNDRQPFHQPNQMSGQQQQHASQHPPQQHQREVPQHMVQPFQGTAQPTQVSNPIQGQRPKIHYNPKFLAAQAAQHRPDGVVRPQGEPRFSAPQQFQSPMSQAVTYQGVPLQQQQFQQQQQQRQMMRGSDSQLRMPPASQQQQPHPQHFQEAGNFQRPGMPQAWTQNSNAPQNFHRAERVSPQFSQLQHPIHQSGGPPQYPTPEQGGMPRNEPMQGPYRHDVGPHQFGPHGSPPGPQHMGRQPQHQQQQQQQFQQGPRYDVRPNSRPAIDNQPPFQGRVGHQSHGGHQGPLLRMANDGPRIMTPNQQGWGNQPQRFNRPGGPQQGPNPRHNMPPQQTRCPLGNQQFGMPAHRKNSLVEGQPIQTITTVVSRQLTPQSVKNRPPQSMSQKLPQKKQPAPLVKKKESVHSRLGIKGKDTAKSITAKKVMAAKQVVQQAALKRQGSTIVAGASAGPSPPKVPKVQSAAIDDKTGVDSDYIRLLEKQKLLREEVKRKKEMKRQAEAAARRKELEQRLAAQGIKYEDVAPENSPKKGPPNVKQTEQSKSLVKKMKLSQDKVAGGKKGFHSQGGKSGGQNARPQKQNIRGGSQGQRPGMVQNAGANERSQGQMIRPPGQNIGLPAVQGNPQHGPNFRPQGQVIQYPGQNMKAPGGRPMRPPNQNAQQGNMGAHSNPQKHGPNQRPHFQPQNMNNRGITKQQNHNFQGQIRQQRPSNMMQQNMRFQGQNPKPQMRAAGQNNPRMPGPNVLQMRNQNPQNYGQQQQHNLGSKDLNAGGGNFGMSVFKHPPPDGGRKVVQTADYPQKQRRIVMSRSSVSVMIEGLSSSTNSGQIHQMCAQVGVTQSIQLMGGGKALIHFTQHEDAALFINKFDKHMIDLSKINVHFAS